MCERPEILMNNEREFNVIYLNLDEKIAEIPAQQRDCMMAFLRKACAQYRLNAEKSDSKGEPSEFGV